MDDPCTDMRDLYNAWAAEGARKDAAMLRWYQDLSAEVMDAPGL